MLSLYFKQNKLSAYKAKYRKYHTLSLCSLYRKIPVISPGPIQLLKGFGGAYKRRGLYPGGLISGIKKSFLNELIRNKLKLTKSVIKMHLLLNGL